MTVVDPGPAAVYERGYALFVARGDAAVARLSKEAPCPTPSA
jgi:hypothetical protein